MGKSRYFNVIYLERKRTLTNKCQWFAYNLQKWYALAIKFVEVAALDVGICGDVGKQQCAASKVA
jgi:hypothetical protein